FPECTPASVRHAVQQLAAHTLLVGEGTPQAKQDAHVAKVWSRWLPEGSFHFATKDAQYINPEWGLDYLKSILPKTALPQAEAGRAWCAARCEREGSRRCRGAEVQPERAAAAREGSLRGHAAAGRQAHEDRLLD